MSTRRERAFHEAGHALMAHIQGRRVELVSIEGAGGLAGFCFSAPAGAPTWSPEEVAAVATEVARSDSAGRAGPESLSPAETEAAVLRCLAGPEAERLCSGQRHSFGDGFDMSRARELLGDGGRDPMAVCSDLVDARAAARTILADHWSEVEAVALALDASGTLTGDQVRLLVSAVSAPASVAPESAPMVRSHPTRRRVGMVPARISAPRVPFGVRTFL